MMKLRLFFFSSLLLGVLLVSKAQPLSVIDTIWGIPVADPYRWLEDLNSDTTKAWLNRQVQITQAEHRKFDGAKMAIYHNLINNGGASFRHYIKKGNYFFEFRTSSRLTSPVLYYHKSINGFGAIAYNTHDFGKEPLTIEEFEPSIDGKYLAVSLSKAGTDWRTIRVRDLETKNDLSDKIEWVKFSNIAWTEDGFFYSRFKEPPADLVHVAPNAQQQLCFHKLGDLQEDDKVIYTIPDKANSIFHFETTADHRYLILYSITKLNGKLRNAVSYKDLNEGIYAPINLLVATPIEKEIDFNVIGFVNDKFLIATNLDAPRYHVLSCHKDSVNRLEEFIPEYKEVLKSVLRVGDKWLALYFSNGADMLCVFDNKGEMLRGIKFAKGVNVDDFYIETETVVGFIQNTFYTPPVAYTLDLSNYEMKISEETKVLYDADIFTTEIVNYKSKDGTEIPMYLTYKKSLKRDKDNPVLLYGYGGFGVSMRPFCSYANIFFMINNGILAVPLIRGGGEFGDEWHKQGKGLNKQNSFDDFIGAAEYLVKNGYTSKEKLAIRGGSNGGLLVGAVLTQRPDLFKAAISNVGVFDMLRYHLFTHGRLIKDEYGFSEDSVEFKNLLGYSPLHNTKSNTDYPATLLLTAENDDRVPPLHSYKFLQALQDSSSNQKPHILYFEKEAGHQGSSKIDNRYLREAFILAFIYNQMGIVIPTDYRIRF